MSHEHHHHHGHGDRHGAKQPERFDPTRAARLEDPERLTYLPVEDVLELLDAPRDACVIDFGTGTGVYAIAIARARSDLRIVALDEQPEMLALLRAKPDAARLGNLEPVGPEAVATLRGCAQRILAINVLHELGDDALHHVGELLAPAGRAVFIDWNADADRPVGPPSDHVYAPVEARARLEANGFRVASAERLFAYHFALVATYRSAPAERDSTPDSS
ncbi:MAG TPA: class I SAM-dependent methyltransferase [Candidatus Dormibacteraeota bacterium]|nr:class I SAM-dependent methyltransferase [Candidatus Dormibacteraeota bacterium]